MDFLKCELGSSNETRVTSILHGNEVVGTEAEMVSNMTEEKDRESMTIPVIKTEPEVSCVSVVLRTFHAGCIQNCLPLYQCVLVKQNFDSKECISSSF
jgi:hypothetical protein